MPRRRGVRGVPRTGVTTGHAIAAQAPVLAAMVEEAMRACVVPGTRSSYECAANQFEAFVVAHGGEAFPVNAVWLAAWVLWAAMDISVPSVKVYLYGVRAEHISRGFDWVLDGNAVVSRAVRFVSRKYGIAAKSIKFPITLDILRRLLAEVPMWPNLGLMSHDDRVFACASVIAVLGFLRGGEFLASSGSSRLLLRASDMVVRALGRARVVEIQVRHPKARWWLASESVCCFSPSASSMLDPVWLLGGMRCLSPFQDGDPRRPAFQLADGSPLAKAWMLSKTRGLMDKAGICFPDHLGAVVNVKAASWRAGGACTAKRAGVSDATICHLGRWASLSWLKYSSAVTVTEMQDAVEKIDGQAAG